MKTAVILHNVNRESNEFEAEFDRPTTIGFLKQCMEADYKVRLVEADRKFAWIKKIKRIDPDVTFNIAEGFYGPARESVYAAILDQIGTPYCGPDSTNLLICMNKQLCKELASESGAKINMPRHVIIRSMSDLEKVLDIDFSPLFVKLNSEGSSIGIGKHSINTSRTVLKNVKSLWNKYKRPILIEEYINGKDVSMSYVEGLGVFGPSGISYENDKTVYDHGLKTIRDSEVTIKKAKISPKAKRNLFSYTKQIVKALDIKGYAKLDFRVDRDKVYFIEINGQVSFHPLGEFLTSFEGSSYTKKEIILKILENTSQGRFFSVGYARG